MEISLLFIYNKFMTKLADYLGKVDIQDRTFIGTIAFRNEEITLPDGSKIALGIDDGHWVLVYQQEPGATFQVFEYDQRQKRVILDKKAGGTEEINLFKKLVSYFFFHASTEDLVTILPPQAQA
jgi:hypothetical protein